MSVYLLDPISHILPFVFCASIFKASFVLIHVNSSTLFFKDDHIDFVRFHILVASEHHNMTYTGLYTVKLERNLLF